MGLERLDEINDDAGLSLEELSQTYAELLSRGDDPYGDRRDRAGSDDTESLESELDAAAEPGDAAPSDDDAEDTCELSPRSIVEAVLFVGHPRNEPITSRQLAAMMRGVRAAEVDDLINELNAAYEAQGRPFHIVAYDAGYRLQLRDRWDALRRQYFGRAREARLSQQAIDVLAIVAYNQGLTREDIDTLRDKPCGGILTQLVRRQLLRIERPDKRPRRPRYFTTDRFLELFNLESLDDLPQAAG